MTHPAVVARPPAVDETLHRRVRAAVALAALALYTVTCCPTVHWGDTGELIWAGICLGIAHPPGHPLYSLVAHLFSWLPFGPLAWRINWMSAVFGAVTVVLVFEIAAETLRRLGTSPRRATACAALAAVMLALTTGVWEGSVVAETTTLHVSFIAALVWLVWRIGWVRPAGPTLTLALGAAAALYGFGATNHVAGIFFLPALAVLLVGTCGRAVLHPRNVAVMFACVFAGLTLYAYLYLRSQQDPPLDWGNPETLKNWWWVVSARQFQAGLVQPIGAGPAWTNLADRGRLIAGELTLAGTVLAVWGLLILARRMSWHAAFIVACIVPLVGLGLSSAFILAYFVPGLMFLSIGLAVGAARLWELGPRVPGWACAAAAAGVVLWSGAQHAEAAAHNERSAAVYARAMLDAVPQDGVLFTTNMHMLFTTWAIQAADGYRTDVAVIDWTWAAGDSPVREQMVQRHPDLHFPTFAELELYRERWGAEDVTVDLSFGAALAANFGRRPLYVAVPGRDTEVSAHLAMVGNVFEMRAEPGPYLEDERVARTQAYWTRWAARLDADPALRDPHLTETLAYDLNNQGLFFERFDRDDLARWNYDMAVRIAPERARPYLNRGRLAGAAGAWDHALVDFAAAARVEPRNARTHYFVGTAHEALGDLEAAYRGYLEALFWDAADVDANRRAGLLLLRAKDFGRARSYMEAAQEAGPYDTAVARGLVRVALAEGNFPAAAAALEHARDLDPDSVHLFLLTAEYAARTDRRTMAQEAVAAALTQDRELAAPYLADAAWARDLDLVQQTP